MTTPPLNAANSSVIPPEDQFTALTRPLKLDCNKCLTLDRAEAVRTFWLEKGRPNPHDMIAPCLLDKLPEEVLGMVMGKLDMHTLVTIWQSDDALSDVAARVQSFDFFLKHFPTIIGALECTRTGHLMTCDELYHTVVSPHCFECDEFGPYVHLPTCRRVCYRCSAKDRYLPVTAAIAASKYGLPEDMIMTLPTVTNALSAVLPHPLPNRRLTHLFTNEVVADAARRHHGSAGAAQAYLEKRIHEESANQNADGTNPWTADMQMQQMLLHQQDLRRRRMAEQAAADQQRGSADQTARPSTQQAGPNQAPSSLVPQPPTPQQIQQQVAAQARQMRQAAMVQQVAPQTLQSMQFPPVNQLASWNKAREIRTAFMIETPHFDLKKKTKDYGRWCTGCQNPATEYLPRFIPSTFARHIRQLGPVDLAGPHAQTWGAGMYNCPFGHVLAQGEEPDAYKRYSSIL